MRSQVWEGGEEDEGGGVELEERVERITGGREVVGM